MNAGGLCYKKNILRALALLCVFVMSFFICTASADVANAATERRTVKVGYKLSEGYFIIDGNGNKSGYGFEYLMYMSRYSNWDYEYIDVDDNLENIVSMIENHEIDLLTGVPKTEPYSKAFLFSDYPVFVMETVLTASKNNDSIIPGNYSTFNGIKIGILKNSGKEQDMAKYASLHSFSYQLVYFDDFEDMENALENDGTIDAMLSNNIRPLDNEWVCAQLSQTPLYIVTALDNAQLMTEINYALACIKNQNSYLQASLFTKYFSGSDSDGLVLTTAEERYLAELRKSGRRITAVINPDREPLSYFNDDNEPCGIMAELAAKLEELLQIDIEIISTENRVQYYEVINAGYPVLKLDAVFDYNISSNELYKLTDPYMTIPIALLTKKDYSGEINRIAVADMQEMSGEIISGLIGNKEVVMYESCEECEKAVLNGEVDGFYTLVYSAQNAVNSDGLKRLSYTVVSGYEREFSIGVLASEDYLLLSAVDKAVNSLSDYLDELVFEYTANTRSEGFVAYMYNNPMTFAVIAFLLCAFFALTVVLIVKIRGERIIKKNTSELQRFIGYVCNANESVIEVNLNTMEEHWYSTQDNKVLQVTTQVVWDNFDDQIYPEDYNELRKKLTIENMKRLIEENDEMYFEARSKNSHGEYRWASYLIQGIERDEFHPNNIVLFKKDIDEVKRVDEIYKTALRDALEAARKASRAKGMFMSRMSHEIRTPLNAVLGYITMAKNSQGDIQKTESCIDKCSVAANHLLNIINDVLDISSIESGRFKISHESFDMRNLITGISTMFYSQAKAKGVELIVLVNGLTEEEVIGDQLRVNQIIINLISNAIKFTPNGGKVRFIVDQLKTENGKVNFCFTVSDTGIGMSEEFMSRVFTPFEQESASVSKNYGGTGLGLSISRNLVDIMGGAIEVKSKQGVGTTFTVHLAFDYSENKKKQERESDFSTVRALIAQETSEDCSNLAEMFKRCKVKYTIVRNGEELIKQLKRRMNTDYEYNIVVFDWYSDGEDILKTAEKLRNELGLKIPIVLISPDVSEISDTAEKAGIDKVVSKPLFQSTVLDMLVDTFGKYAPRGKSVGTTDVTGKRILLVEDNEMNMEIATEMLQAKGIIVEQAYNGRLAVEKFDEAADGYYDVILMDIQMPVMDGYEATRTIRSRERAYAKIVPIVAMTAGAFSEDISDALLNGMDDHISKPVNYDALFSVLSRLSAAEENNEED